MFKDKLNDLMSENAIYSQRLLSKLTGIPPTTISGWFNAGRLPDYSAIQKLATFFDVSADYLLELEDETGARAAAPIAPSSDPDEQKLVNVYRTLDDDTKAALWTLLNTWTPTTTFSGAAQKKRIK